MASLEDLPLEVFDLIVGAVAAHDCEGTLAALAATCRRFYNVVMPHLYHDAAKRHPALLHWAAQLGRVSTAKRLLEQGAQVHAAMRWCPSLNGFQAFCSKRTPRQLYQSFRAHVAHHKITMTKKILPPWSFWFPIHLAALSGSVEMVELLVKTAPETMTRPSCRLCQCSADDVRGPSQTGNDYDWCLPLHTAACNGHLDIARWLLEHGCEPEATLKPPPRTSFHDITSSTTILHDAARFGQVDMVKFILDGGYMADVHELDGRELSPIWHAYFHQQWDVVAELNARGADIDDDIGYGYTPLMDACLCRSFVGAAELIDLGANVNVEFYAPPHRIREDPVIKVLQESGARPIDICCRRQLVSSRAVFPGLVPREASQTGQLRYPRARKYDKNEPARRLALVSKLLAAGADPNPGPRDHPPPLVVASANHFSDIVGELIKHGAPVNLADRDGVSPLAAAFAYRDSACPLHPLVHSWESEPRHFLAKISSRPGFTFDRVETRQGTCQELMTCVSLLLLSGAEVNPAGADVNTPLCRLIVAPDFRRFIGLGSEPALWISQADRSRILPLLLQRGADAGAEMTSSKQWLAHYKTMCSTRYRAPRWPLNAMEHAFWDSDFDACRHLLEAGAAPSQETARWMIHLLLEDNPGKTHDDTQEALNFIKGLPDEWRRAVFRDPFCLALALQHGWPDLAQESWGFGLELGQFSEKLRAAYFIDHFWADDDDDLAELGEVCLDAAVRNEATSILEGLLELGVKAIPPQALLYLIDDVDNLGILKSLVEHGGKVHIRDNETDGDGTFQQHPHWLEVEGCINAMKLAILRRDHSAIRTMLKYSPEPVDPWFRYFYLKEAYTLLEPATVACLLEHPSMRFDEADITHEADLPLAHLVRNVGKICSRPGNPAVEYGPQARMDAVKIWIDCIAAFSQAGVDPTMRDRAGKSALDYLEEHLAYVGKDRFKNHLALALRLDGGLDPEHELGLAGCFYEVLKSIEIMQDTTE